MKKLRKELNFKLYNSYILLQNLKYSLGLKKNPNLSLSAILDLVKDLNENEIFLLTYLVEQVFCMPEKIQQQFDLLNYSDKNYSKQIKILKKLFASDEDFINYSNNIYEQLEIRHLRERYFFNAMIYEIAKDYINAENKLCLQSPVINLHFLRKWLDNAVKIPILKLNETELQIMRCLFWGYSKEDILENNPSGDIDNLYHLNAEINNIIPAKMQVENITQALAKYYYLMLTDNI